MLLKLGELGVRLGLEELDLLGRFAAGVLDALVAVCVRRWSEVSGREAACARGWACARGRGRTLAGFGDDLCCFLWVREEG